MPLESSLVSQILRTLNALPGCYAYKNHGGPMVTAGLPDIVCVHRGRTVFLEVKLPGRKPTPIQIHRIAQLRAAGAAAEVVHSVEEALKVTTIRPIIVCLPLCAAKT